MDRTWRVLGDISSLKSGQSFGFDIPEAQGTGNEKQNLHSLFVVKADGALAVFRNRCPHLGIRLEWQPDQFLDINGHFIICSTHSALFRTTDGFCISGPCAGDMLEAIPFKIDQGVLSVSI